MPGGKTKFSAEWLHHIDSNRQKLGEWCRKGKDNFHAYCRFCDVDMKRDNSGKKQLLQHAKKEKHRKAITSVKDDKQGKLFFPAAAASSSSSGTFSCSSKLEVINYSDSALVAQIYWLGKVACSNFSLRSIDNIGSTFAHMFPDSKIAANFSLSRTSSSYMIGEGMAPVLRNTIVQDVVNSGLPFCIHFDETTTAQVKKQMDLTLRYWSPTHNKVWVTFYNSLFFGHAEGDKVASKMHEEMSEDGLQLNNLITLVRDGPNVNKTIFRKLENLIKEEHTDFLGFVDLGSCALHLVHNAFGKGLEKFGKDIDQLCLDLHALFKYSAARREDFVKLQMEMNANIQNFQQHTEVRWLSIGPAINRILEQWDVIVKFIEDLAKDEKKSPKSVNYKRAAALLTGSEKASTKVLLEFLKNIILVFEEFLTVFQKSGPTIHTVYDSMCNTLLKLMRRFLKPSALEGKYGSNLEAVQCQDVKLQLTDNELVVGDKVRKELSKLKPEKQKLMVLGIRAFSVAAITHLQTKLPLRNSILQDLGCLNPIKRGKKSTEASIQNITRKFQPNLEVVEVVDEWKIYQIDDDVSALDITQEVDQFWNKVFQVKSDNGIPKYSVLPLVVKCGLVLAQTNSESERSLSINAGIVTKERASLGETTIVGLRTVKDAVKFFYPENQRPENILVTKDLKLSVKSAHAKYLERLEKEKIEFEKKKEEARLKREAEERKERENAKLLESKKCLNKDEEELEKKEKAARQTLAAADELLSEATDKLQNAVTESSVNKQSVQVASMMLETAKSNREKAMKNLDEMREQRKKLESKTRKLLDKAIPSSSTNKRSGSDEKNEGCKKAKKS